MVALGLVFPANFGSFASHLLAFSHPDSFLWKYFGGHMSFVDIPNQAGIEF